LEGVADLLLKKRMLEIAFVARPPAEIVLGQVAAQLGNAVAVCRKSYIHPEAVEAYLDATLLRHLGEEAALEDLAGLRQEEVAVLALLQQRPARSHHRRAASSR